MYRLLSVHLPNLSTTDMMSLKAIFKAGLISEFSFSKSSCLNNSKEPSLPY